MQIRVPFKGLNKYQEKVNGLSNEWSSREAFMRPMRIPRQERDTMLLLPQVLSLHCRSQSWELSLETEGGVGRQRTISVLEGVKQKEHAREAYSTAVPSSDPQSREDVRLAEGRKHADSVQRHRPPRPRPGQTSEPRRSSHRLPWHQCSGPNVLEKGL